MVLYMGGDYMVAGFPVQSQCYHVDAFSSVAGEYGMFVIPANESGYCFAGVLEMVGGLPGKPMCSPAVVGCIFVEIITHGLHDLARGLGGGAAVKIYIFFQDREVLSDVFGVEHW